MRRVAVVLLLSAVSTAAWAGPFSRPFRPTRAAVRAAIRNAKTIKSAEARNQLLENSAYRLTSDLSVTQLTTLVREMTSPQVQDRAVRAFVGAHATELSIDEVVKVSAEIQSAYPSTYHEAIAANERAAAQASRKEDALLFLGYVRHPGYDEVAQGRAMVMRNREMLAQQKAAIDEATDRLRDGVLLSYYELRGSLGAADLLKLAQAARLSSTRTFFEDRAAMGSR